MKMGFAMFTPEGDALVRRVAIAATRMMEHDGATLSEAFDFAIRKLRLLQCGEGFEEADDTAVREEVFAAIEKGVYRGI